MLPGRTGKEWARFSLISCGIGVVGGAGAVIGALTEVARSHRIDPVTGTFLGLFLLGFGVGWVLGKVSYRKLKAEVRAGYTTSAQGFNQVRRVHSPTGVVMREAGQMNLSRAEWESAMVRVRAFEESQSKQHRG